MLCGYMKTGDKVRLSQAYDKRSHNKKMKDQLEAVIRNVFQIKEDILNWNWTSNDVEAWDSVGHLNLILELEKAFGIKFEIEEMFELEKLKDIENILSKKKVL